MYLELKVETIITEASIEEALKNHFNCIFVKEENKIGYSTTEQMVRVRHVNTTDVEWESEPKPPLLFIRITTQEVDEIEEPMAAIFSAEDETGDAHQYLMGAAISPEMIAAACYFAT